jgi:hypothetical protein
MNMNVLQYRHEIGLDANTFISPYAHVCTCLAVVGV